MAPIAISPPLSPSLSSVQPTESLSQYQAYDHVHWYVGNAKQAAAFYVSRHGIRTRRVSRPRNWFPDNCVPCGQERQRHIRPDFASPSPVTGFAVFRGRTSTAEGDPCAFGTAWRCGERSAVSITNEIYRADAVADVAFEVDSVDAIYDAAVRNGAQVVARPRATKDTHGHVKLATIKTYGDTTHTLVERRHYSGIFLPGYRDENGGKDPLSRFLPSVGLEAIDHCVGNQDWDEMEDVCD